MPVAPKDFDVKIIDFGLATENAVRIRGARTSNSLSLIRDLTMLVHHCQISSDSGNHHKSSKFCQPLFSLSFLIFKLPERGSACAEYEDSEDTGYRIQVNVNFRIQDSGFRIQDSAPFFTIGFR